jgi:16S rRNA (uracil1498-N3)-methyltransferase
VRLPGLKAIGEPILLDEDPNAEPILRTPPLGKEVSLLVGPEGGWTEREREWLLKNSWRPVSLGPNILKTETAAIAALAIIQAARYASV